MPARKKEPEDLTAKKELALEVIDRLKKEYPDAGCTLDYDHAWQLLVSVRLAAQCTDARVNIVVEDLFARYPSVAALAAAAPEAIEAIVKPCGRHQGAAEGRNGPVEDHSAGRGQRPVPPLCDARPRCVQCPQAGMRKMLSE